MRFFLHEFRTQYFSLWGTVGRGAIMSAKCQLRSQNFGMEARSPIWGGGGEARSPICTDSIKKHVHVTYMRERAKRVSASETYIFSGLIKIYTPAYIYNQCSSFYYMWYGPINDSIPHKTLTLRKIYDYASELRKCSHFHILKRHAVSFNVLLVLQILCLRNIYSFRSRNTSACYTINVHVVHFITCGMAL